MDSLSCSYHPGVYYLSAGVEPIIKFNVFDHVFASPAPRGVAIHGANEAVECCEPWDFARCM